MSGGYKSLLVYRCAVTIDDFTEIFCSRFLSDLKYKRTVEQMIQAKRSGKQNIAEGSKELSSASDLPLSSVSRSSYTELAEDYEDFLRHRGMPIWTNLDFNNPENFANMMVTLCYKQGYLMDQFLRSKEKLFVEKGGFRENLFKKRAEYKKTKFDSLDKLG